MKIRILIVEDDAIWRSMLTRFLNSESDLQVVHSTDTKESALAFCTSNEVDIVLMDINLTHNHLDGLQATLELNLIGHEAKVIMLTSLDDERIILDAFTAGAVQYISKTDFRKIPETIREASRSRSPQSILIKEFLRIKESEQYNRLTVAEREIISLSEAGNGRQSMMVSLSKSEGTLKNQITSILRKFNSKSLKDVVRIIKSRGLTERELER
ncbi:response regulator transcription factor [Paenibacillus sinopodophylli]|uniref:response regulator transcription factor n=1 Tax=Paenibacillus sinopodophylli TaxID=1837342 RepID=UPI00110D16BB|nr:response regulator transcription factor [Paenibacillus sinopodophylli]